MNKTRESGILLTELAVVVGIAALIVGAAVTVTYRTYTDTRRTNDHLVATRNVENAGYWLSRDVQMAERLGTENLTQPQFLILKWTEWGYDQPSVYHAATYSIENVSGGVGTLKRRHEDSLGNRQDTLIAERVYYNPADPPNTTGYTYQQPMLTLQLVASVGETRATRNYRLYLRPNFID